MNDLPLSLDPPPSLQALPGTRTPIRKSEKISPGSMSDFWSREIPILTWPFSGSRFLGYLGAMDRVLFAIGPHLNGFYFGPLF